MIEGNPKVFAIESAIAKAYESKSNYALGYFVVHIDGKAYGVRSPEASLLACSVCEVRERCTRRGKHIASFSEESNVGLVANSFRHAIYAPNQEKNYFFGIPQRQFIETIYSHNLLWAPDGDEAFYDGSFVLHFDIKDKVRLIAFKCNATGYDHDPESLAEIWISADYFYNILNKWQHAFEMEWSKLLQARQRSKLKKKEQPKGSIESC